MNTCKHTCMTKDAQKYRIHTHSSRIHTYSLTRKPTPSRPSPANTSPHKTW